MLVEAPEQGVVAEHIPATVADLPEVDHFAVTATGHTMGNSG